MLMEEFRTAKRVGLYSPYKNEVRTEKIFENGDRNRKQLYYPAIDPEEGMIAYFRVMEMSELKPDEAGFRQPNQKKSRVRDIDNMEMLIVPAVVVDLSGCRLGFGKGFYDTCLDEFRGFRVALVYDDQVVSDLPIKSGPRRLDWIVTEKRIIKCN